MIIKTCGFIIYRNVDSGVQYLLLQASTGSNHWSPPKGRMMEGESELQTAYRETMEETGIIRQYLEIHESCKYELNFKKKDGKRILVYWLVKLLKSNFPVTLSTEHKDFAWIILSQASNFIKYRDMQETLHMCESYIKGEII